MASGHGMKSFQNRVTKLEQRHRPRLPGLSSERRKYLTDKAVAGDQGALNLHRQPMIYSDPARRAAALAAGLRLRDKGNGIERTNDGAPARWQLKEAAN